MKLYFYYLVIVIISCGSRSSLEPDCSMKLKSNQDTFVFVQDNIELEDYKQRRYTVVIKNDTSSLSLLLSENKIDSTFSAKLENNCGIFDNDKGDTLAYRTRDYLKVPSKKLTLNEIGELRLILKEVDREYSLDRIKFLRLYIGDIEDASRELTLEYHKKFGKKLGYEKVNELLRKSKLVNTLNTIFSAHSLKIKDVETSEILYYQKKENKLETINVEVIFRFMKEN